MEKIYISKLVSNLGLFILSFLLLLSLYISSHKPLDNKDILGVSDTDNLTITAVVNPQQIEFIVYPEKRVPATGNWNTIAHFRILDCNTKVVLYDFPGIVTDNTGTGTISTLPSQNVLGGTYAYSVKGYSHLNKHFSCYPLLTAGTTLDFTPEGELLAGDTSVVVDNYVNSLDISNNILNLFTSDYKNDLNQDSEVNSLDLSNIITNLFILGDPY